MYALSTASQRSLPHHLVSNMNLDCLGGIGSFGCNTYAERGVRWSFGSAPSRKRIGFFIESDEPVETTGRHPSSEQAHFLAHFLATANALSRHASSLASLRFVNKGVSLVNKGVSLSDVA